MNPQTSPYPTPYDIVGFPTFAWEPNLLLWFIAGALFVGSLAYYLLSKPKRSERAEKRIWSSCKAELARIIERSTEQEHTRESAAAASRSVRRLLEVYLQKPITTLSSSEISTLLIESSLSPAIRQIFNIVQKLDDWRFAPSVDSARVQEEILALMRAIDTQGMD